MVLGNTCLGIQAYVSEDASRPSVARYVKTSLFLQSPET